MMAKKWHIQQKVKSLIWWLSGQKNIAWIMLIGYILIFFEWLFFSGPSTSAQASPLEQFWDKRLPIIAIWGIFIAFMNSILPHVRSESEQANRLRRTQKERIRILDNFGPANRMIEFFDDRSIYNAIISMLDRLSNEPNLNAGETRYEVCMLLCSPALDYPENPESKSTSGRFEWGLEFRDRIEDLAGRRAIGFDICHLPLDSFSGINAMKDFIAVLANYIAKSDDDFQNAFDSLWRRAEAVATDFTHWAGELSDKKHRFHVKTHVDIPFQIVLVNSAKFTEVVISFAGRDILEREQEYEVKGFFSNDPYVVKTLHEVFKTYVQSKGQIPYIPPHTCAVIKEHEVFGDHIIPSFYYDLVKNLHVPKETFSPAIGNSSKFVVWLLDKLLTAECSETGSHWCRRVLDVGSGTGVLALASSAVLRKCIGEDYSVVALDSCPHAWKVLSENCDSDKNIKVFPWKLCYKENSQGGIESSWFQNEKGKKVEIQGDFLNFDLIIADLPFVHAKPSDLRFLDLNHSLHQAFFKIAADTSLLSRNGRIVTAFSSLVVRQSDNLGYWSLFTCRSRKAGLIRHPNLSHGQTTRWSR